MAKVLTSMLLLVASECGANESLVTTKTTGDSAHGSTSADPPQSSSGETNASPPTSTSTTSDRTDDDTSSSTTGAVDDTTGITATTVLDTTTSGPGPCSGELLADKLGGPWSFTRQGDYFYFTTLLGEKFEGVNDGGVWRVAVDGGEPELLVGQLDGMGIATTATDLFWSEFTGPLMRANLDGSAPQSLMLGARPIGVDGTHLFAATTISVDRFPLAGGPREKIVDAVEEAWYYSYELAVDDKRVYWTTGDTVESVDKDGGDRITHATDQNYAGGVASDGEYVFWLDINNPDGCELRRAPVTGGPFVVLWTDPTPFMVPRDCSPGTAKIAVDEDHVYWGGDLVQRVPKLGGPPEVVAACNVLYVRDILVDDTHVYWINHVGACEMDVGCLNGSLWRTLKPN